MEVKDIIKNRRIEKQPTLDDVAQLVGVSGATISRWESGDIANMKRDKIVALADALDLSPGVIMGWEVQGITTCPERGFEYDSSYEEDIEEHNYEHKCGLLIILVCIRKSDYASVFFQ